jgi:6-pyruvoyltetrahydropterin/6-carboxytetrahydropterin synthase
MSERFTVRIVKEQLVFCSGHFISYEGDKCERLHGHNYRVGVEVSGPLDENRYVFDFIALKRLMRAIVEELDHRMLLPLRNPLVRVEATESEVAASYRDRRWVFPREDCVLLPIANTTAEELARHIAGRVQVALSEQYGFQPDSLRVEVEEAPGQSAVYEWQPGPTASRPA